MKLLKPIIFSFLFCTNSFCQINNGLLLNYLMDGDAIDQSGLSNDGNLVNTIPIEDKNGNSNSALSFNGNSGVILPLNATLKPNLPITLSFIIKADALNQTQPLFQSDATPFDYAGFFVNLTSSGQIMAHIGGNRGNNTSTNRRSFLSDDRITVGKWHRVLVTINSFDDMRIYIDCYKSSGSYSGSGSNVMFYSGSQGMIGQGPPTPNYPNGYFFEGALDEVSLWNRELTDIEISEVCDGALSITKNIKFASSIIYPNPADAQLTISIPSFTKNEKLEYNITNTSGQIISSNRISSNEFTIPVEQLSNGVYFISIFDEIRKVFTQKISILK